MSFFFQHYSRYVAYRDVSESNSLNPTLSLQPNGATFPSALSRTTIVAYKGRFPFPFLPPSLATPVPLFFAIAFSRLGSSPFRHLTQPISLPPLQLLLLVLTIVRHPSPSKPCISPTAPLRLCLPSGFGSLSITVRAAAIADTHAEAPPVAAIVARSTKSLAATTTTSATAAQTPPAAGLRYVKQERVCVPQLERCLSCNGLVEQANAKAKVSIDQFSLTCCYLIKSPNKHRYKAHSLPFSLLPLTFSDFVSV
jgi:hypothetical protein